MQPMMETRTCPCGCGVSFRVLTTSPQVYAALSHEPKTREQKTRAWGTGIDTSLKRNLRSATIRV